MTYPDLIVVEISGVNSEILVLSICASDKGWVGISGMKSKRLMLLPFTCSDKGWLCSASVLAVVELLLERISLSDSDLLKDDLQKKKVSPKFLKRKEKGITSIKTLKLYNRFIFASSHAHIYLIIAPLSKYHPSGDQRDPKWHILVFTKKDL